MASPAVADATYTPRHNAAGTSYTGDKPISTATGDLLIAHVYIKFSGPTTFTTIPTGWTKIDVEVNSTSQSQTIWIKQADGTEGSTFVWGSANSVISSITIGRVTGFDTANPINTSSSYAETVTNLQKTFNTVTTTVADTLLLYIIANLTTTAWFSWSGGVTQRWNGSTGSGGTTRVVGGGSEAVAAIGTTTARTVGGASNVSCLHTIAIAPAATPASLIIPTETVQRILSRR